MDHTANDDLTATVNEAEAALIQNVSPVGKVGRALHTVRTGSFSVDPKNRKLAKPGAIVDFIDGRDAKSYSSLAKGIGGKAGKFLASAYKYTHDKYPGVQALTDPDTNNIVVFADRLKEVGETFGSDKLSSFLLNRLFAHEIGHRFGLDDVKGSNDTMVSGEGLHASPDDYTSDEKATMNDTAGKSSPFWEPPPDPFGLPDPETKRSGPCTPVLQ